MRRLIYSVVLSAILLSMLAVTPVQAASGYGSIHIDESGVHVSGTVSAYESSYSNYKRISLGAWVNTSNPNNWVSAIVVYISMWNAGQDENEGVTKVYLSPDLRDPMVPELLYPQGITPLGPGSWRYLSVYLFSEEDSDPDFGKVTLIVHGEEWQAYCYVAYIDFTGSVPTVTPDPDEAEDLAWQAWYDQILHLPTTIADLL